MGVVLLESKTPPELRGHYALAVVRCDGDGDVVVPRGGVVAQHAVHREVGGATPQTRPRHVRSVHRFIKSAVLKSRPHHTRVSLHSTTPHQPHPSTQHHSADRPCKHKQSSPLFHAGSSPCPRARPLCPQGRTALGRRRWSGNGRLWHRLGVWSFAFHVVR